jgi:hypothetical protein
MLPKILIEDGGVKASSTVKPTSLLRATVRLKPNASLRKAGDLSGLFLKGGIMKFVEKEQIFTEILSPITINKDKGCHETSDRVKCPKCGHTDKADASSHVYFDQNKWALRCRVCHHVWPGPLCCQ